MKRENHYIALLLALTLFFTACDKIEPEFFDEDYNGAYFDYQYAADFEKTLNFGEYIVGNPQEIPVILNIKLLGYLQDETRSLSIKTKEVEGYELAEVIIPEVTFENKEYQKGVEILVKRPKVEDEVFAVCIYLDGKGDLGAGIDGKEEYIIYAKEVHEKPSIWTGLIQTYLGEWNREKHAFLANLMNDDYYYNALYDTKTSQVKSNETIRLNELAVNTLLSQEPEEPITLNFPILGESERANYNEPYFWDKEIIGHFNLSKFDLLIRKTGNKNNTAEVFDAYEKAIKETADVIKDYNKEAVLEMLDEYYNYPKLGYTIDQYKEHFWVKIFKPVPYTSNTKSYLRIPYWWEDPDNLGTAEIVKKYFGEYSDKKYQFMIKAIIDLDGEENLNVASILPFAIDTENNTYKWDETVGGEARFKECYKTIIEAYGSWTHDFPDVEELD